jgi:AhpD family alkylhydroperoxidase
MRLCVFIFCTATAFAAATVQADQPSSLPRPIPLTRPEMKQLLEDMKARTPRIPLPELTEEEKAKLGERGASYEGRLRALYTPNESRGGFFSAVSGGPRPERAPGGGQQPAATSRSGRSDDPRMTLDYRFKTSLFWIVSRTNNCQYCLGHQESKLLAAGMSEDEIAALDFAWEEFGPAEQAAFALARKLTLEPHRLTDADIERVRKHYTDLQVLEMVLSVAGNNSINRWKEGVGVPQSAGGGGFGRRTEGAPAEPRSEHSYLTPTSEKFQTKVSLVAPLYLEPSTGKPTRQTVSARPDLASRSEVEETLVAARKRAPRLPVVVEAAAREVLAEHAPQSPLPQWMRLLANYPVAGPRSVASIRASEEKGDLSPLLKAQVSWIIARQDQAWYALGQSQRRLKELGQSDDQIFALDGDGSGFTPVEQSMFAVARKLAASPVVLTDDDVAQAVKLAGPRDVVQLISYTTHRASFDRITEAAGLPIDP